jgi:hypothetical protein
MISVFEKNQLFIGDKLTKLPCGSAAVVRSENGLFLELPRTPEYWSPGARSRFLSVLTILIKMYSSK